MLQENYSWHFLFISITLILKSALLKYIHFKQYLQYAAMHSVTIKTGQAILYSLPGDVLGAILHCSVHLIEVMTESKCCSCLPLAHGGLRVVI